MVTKEIEYCKAKADIIWEVALKNNISPNDSVGIIGGNSLLTATMLNDSETEITFCFQKLAFETAIELSKKIKAIGAKPTITIIIDQSQDIRHFLGLEEKRNNKGEIILNSNGIPVLKKVSPKKKKGHLLSHLHKDLLTFFNPILDEHGLNANEIKILFEIQCRAKIKDYYSVNKNNPNLPSPILEAMVKDGNCKADKCNTVPKNIKVASCKGITSNCLNKAVQYASEVNLAKFCIGIWGFDKRRCNKSIIDGGTQIAKYIFIPETKIANFFLQEPDDIYVHSLIIKKV